MPTLMSRWYTFVVYVLLVSILCLSGCIYHQNLSVFPRTSKTKACKQENDSLVITVQKFDSADSVDYFGVDFPVYGFIPLHVHIHNPGNDYQVVRSGDISLGIAPVKQIAELMYYNTQRFVSWTTTPALLFFWQALGVTIPAALAMYYFNVEIDKNLREKVLKNGESIKIQPHQTINKFLFTYSDDLPKSFYMTAHNKRTGVTSTFDFEFPF
jgi:hypothetical protein